MRIVPAHSQQQTIRIRREYPAHNDRDLAGPAKAAFARVKRRLKSLGLWKCVFADEDCYGQIELHHSHIEDAYAPATDVDRLNTLLGLHLTPDE